MSSPADSATTRGRRLVENARHLIFQCVYESSADPQLTLESLLARDEAGKESRYRSDGLVLNIPGARSMSARTQASLLDIVNRWRSPRGRSGLVPVVVGHTFIQELHVQECSGPQLSYMGTLLRHMINLQSAEITCAGMTSQADLERFCEQLAADGPPLALSKLVLRFTAHSVSDYQTLIDVCGRKLVYLDELSVEMSSLQLIRSVVAALGAPGEVVPLDELHLSGLDLTEEDLTTLTPRLPCFMFIRLLDLSNNIVTSHMVEMAAHFSSLKYLEVCAILMSRNSLNIVKLNFKLTAIEAKFNTS